MGLQRDIDSGCEAVFGNYLDSCFYEKKAEEYRRVKNRKEQLMGIDVIASFNFADGSSYDEIKIDEKTQTHYINKNLQTNAFEITSIQSGGRRLNGWFVDDRLETEYYMVGFPFSHKNKWNRKKLKNLKTEDISQIDMLLIEKKKLLDRLKDYGYTKDRMLFEAKELVDKNKGGKTVIKGMPFNYYYSTHLREHPVCLLIDKKLLRDVAEKRFLVHPTHIKTI